MFIECEKLCYILDILLLSVDTDSNKILELYKEDYCTVLAVNYNDECYIKYSIELEWDIELDLITISYRNAEKIHEITKMWPKSQLKISLCHSSGLLVVESTGVQKTLREPPVYIECTFNPCYGKYVLKPPYMNHTCIVNSSSIKKMLDLCSGDGGVNLEIKDKSLLVKSNDSSLITSVEIEDVREVPNEIIELYDSECNVISAFLNRLMFRTNSSNVLLIFMDYEYAFSLKYNKSSGIDEYVQLFTVHG